MLSQDPNPEYTEDTTIMNTAPKFGDLWSLFLHAENIRDF